MEATLQKPKVKKKKLIKEASKKVPEETCPTSGYVSSSTHENKTESDREEAVKNVQTSEQMTVLQNESSVLDSKEDHTAPSVISDEKVMLTSPVSSDNMNKVAPSEISSDNMDKVAPSEISSDNINQITSSVISDAKEEYALKLPRMEMRIAAPQNMYPDLKSIQFSEQIDNIICTQTLMKTHIFEYKTKTIKLANDTFEEFVQEAYGLNSHPLKELIHDFQKAKHSTIQLHKKIKYLLSDLKRKKDFLWKSIKKEAFAKGKCEDGFHVNISHSYIIKELDQEKFQELGRTLMEIVDSISLVAYYSYLENLVKKRIESHLYEFFKDDSKEFDEYKAEDLSSLKKCISILFDCQRQNPPDKTYIETSRNWLHNLVIKLLKHGSFLDNVFIMNHVLRCPNGIENWASSFIQVPMKTSSNDYSQDCCDDSQKFLLMLFVVLNPIPHREAFLKNIKEQELSDGDFTVLDSDGEEEETTEFVQKWSDDDILSLLKQIPLRLLYKHLLLDVSENQEVPSEEKMLEIFSYSSAVVDILFDGLKTYRSEEFPKLSDHLCNLIRHVLLYVSKYWDLQRKFHFSFRLSLQAVYDKFFFHIIYEIIRLEQWKILPFLTYNFISNKMLWNILWIFSNPRSEEEVFSEKDVERKMKDDSLQIQLMKEIKRCTTQDAWHILSALEKIALSSNRDEDFLKFLTKQIFQIVFVDQNLRENLSKEGCVVLSSIIDSYPKLVPVLFKEVNENEEAAFYCIGLFRKMSLRHWIPNDADISIISSWLLSHSLKEGKNNLARTILTRMNWNYNDDGFLYLPTELHKRIALLIAEAYMKFDASTNEWVVSRGIKQMLQFTNISFQQENEEGFVHWAWNTLFSLRLHPLDGKSPPWISIYDGSIDISNTSNSDDIFCKALLADYEKRHPCVCYLMIVMTDVGHNIKNLMKTGLDCLSSLIENQQYMAAIRAFYYILPFFVKCPELFLDEVRFLQATTDLITADMGILSNLTKEPVIGSVLHNLAAMIKHQIHQASESTVECAVPLLKLWIKILMKIQYDVRTSKQLKYCVKQINFLLDILVKISYMHTYTRECTIELFHSVCNTSNLPLVNQPFWKKIFSSYPVYSILYGNEVLDYPLLVWFVVSSEVKQKKIIDFWTKAQIEILNHKERPISDCLKKTAVDLKMDHFPVECLPIYRWATQLAVLPPSNPISPLLWQQFFSYFFERIRSSNLQIHNSLGLQYFKFGPFIDLMDQMKKQLRATVQYYGNLVKSSDFHNTPTFEDNKCNNITDVLLISNLLKLFSAFLLWIDNESLHNSNLCLSALEPKYCPERLELILKGDQNPWFDFVPSKIIKDELEQKIKLWHVTKFFEDEPTKTTKQETLPKQILRHVSDYEQPITDINYKHIDIDCSVNDTYIFSEDALLRAIEKNQSIIFSKAKYFAEQMKKMKQLNFNYLNWVPQEFENVDSKITKKKTCHKGTGQSGCSGAANFTLQIQKYVRNERLVERMDNNRKDFVILQDQLTNLSVDDLCDSSLLIENYIKKLSKKMNAAENEESRHLRKTGVSLFYHQINAMEKIISSIAEYSPSRLFFSSVIDTLGSEFILRNDEELQGLAKTILNHPEAGNLALNLFDPNNSTPEYFLQVYDTLTTAIGKYSPSTLLALLSKIDFSDWLKNYSPPFDCRKKIFTYICNALLHCGVSPVAEIYPIFEILKKHFKIVLLYMFPDLFCEAVRFLLNGISNKQLSNEVLFVAFFCFGCPLFNEKALIEDIEIGLKKFAENQRLTANQQMYVSNAQLNVMQVKYASKIVYEHFSNKHICFDLYKNHLEYIKAIGIFLGILSYSVITLQLEDVLTQTQDLWKEFQLPFSPWLHPCEVNGSICFPWSDKGIEMARYMFQVYRICLNFFHEQLSSSDSKESILSYEWNHYMQMYIAPGYRHYSFSLYHDEIQLLPWHKFHPTACDIEGMCRILQSNMDESKQFLSKISLKIPWSDVMNNISSTKNPGCVAKVLATLGKLLIISQLKSTDAEKKTHSTIFKDLESLNWQLLSIEDVEELLKLYYSNCEIVVLDSSVSNNPHFETVQFLKLVCSMVSNANGEEFSNSKRILYLQKYISALSNFILKQGSEVKTDELKNILPAVFSELDGIISNSVEPDVQIKFSLPLVKEALVFLDSLTDNEMGSTVLQSLTSWLKTNTQSPLLLPCLKASCSLQSISHIVTLNDCCISARFSKETLGSCNPKNIWHLISSFFCVPPRFYALFVEKCIEDNSFLALYCYVIHTLIPQSAILEKKIDLLRNMIQWMKESTFKSSSESKVLLIWDKILELCIIVVLHNEHQIVKQELITFCFELGILAEDRGNSGFFSVIGFGPASTLSINFRFLCRVMQAFILCQIPVNNLIRMEPISPGHISHYFTQNDTSGQNYGPSTTALKALDSLKALLKKKSYAALNSQVEYAIKCILDPNYNFSESRKFLKYFAVNLYPKESYLSTLGT